jgi:FeS assembly SUF system protein
MNDKEVQALKEKAVEAMRKCYDPEIPVNIYDLGLIYETKVEPSGFVHVRMTLTAPGCPAAGVLPGEVEDRIRVLPSVTDVKVDVVWDPPWNKDMMSEAAKLQLGFL